LLSDNEPIKIRAITQQAHDVESTLNLGLDVYLTTIQRSLNSVPAGNEYFKTTYQRATNQSKQVKECWESVV
jgi:hypothetical protein